MSKMTLVCAVAAISLGACVPLEPDNDLARTFPEETKMGRVQVAEKLQVGVPSDRPALADPRSGEGFVALLGKEVADSLGVEMELILAPNDELIPLIDAGDVDLVFPATAITEVRVRRDNDEHLFLDPFLVAHQRLLVKGNAVPKDLAPQALAGKAVCAATDPETELDLSVIEPTVEIISASAPDECTSLMAGDEVAATTGSDVVLLGIRTSLCGAEQCDGESAVLVGDQLRTFGYGPVIEGGASSWKDYVTNVLEEAQQEGRWETYYEENLTGLSDGAVLEPPGMTVEEAAALFPKELQEDQ